MTVQAHTKRCRAGRLRIGLLTMILAAAGPWNAQAQSFFDKLKDKAREAVGEGIEETVTEAVNGEDSAANSEKAPLSTAVESGAALSGAPGVGRWQGQVGPKGKGGYFNAGGLEVLLDGETGILRYSAASTRCLGELSGGDGSYEVAFVTGQSTCGTRASLTLGGEGDASLVWEDAADTSAAEKVYAGKLARTHAAWPERWSVAEDLRDAHDVVGFRLGMTYEEALEYLKEEHPEFAHEWRVLADAGSTTIVEQLLQKDAETIGPNIVAGQQMTLVFEAQSPEEMEVAQDPQVLERRKEIERLKEERAKTLRQRRQERMARSRSRSRDSAGQAVSAAGTENDLPPIPEMPALRPSGAEGELLVIVRAMTFSGSGRPHEAAVTDALVEKYGAPSARVDQGPLRTLQWVFDAEGDRIADATGGPCEHISKAPGRIEGLVDYYGVKGLYVSKGLQIAIPPTVAPQCGLTVKARLRYDDRDQGVSRLSVVVYDQQRLLGDEWKKVSLFSRAYLADEKAKQAATKAVKAPEL